MTYHANHWDRRLVGTSHSLHDFGLMPAAFHQTPSAPSRLKRRMIATPAASPRAMDRVPVKALPILVFNATDAAFCASPFRDETFISSKIMLNMGTAAPSGRTPHINTTGETLWRRTIAVA